MDTVADNNTGQGLATVNTENSEIIDDLQSLLADFSVFFQNLRGIYWNLRGYDFYRLHEFIEEMCVYAGDKAEEVAERILISGVSPKNRFTDYIELSTIDEIDGKLTDRQIFDHIFSVSAYLMDFEKDILESARRYGDDITREIMTEYIEEQRNIITFTTAFLH